MCTTCSQQRNIKDEADRTVLGVENEITAFVCVLALQPFLQMDAIIASNQIQYVFHTERETKLTG